MTKQSVYDENRINSLRELTKNCGTASAALDALEAATGLSRDNLIRMNKRHGLYGGKAAMEAAKSEIRDTKSRLSPECEGGSSIPYTWNENKKELNATVSAEKAKVVTKIEEVIALCNVDTSIWKVKSFAVDQRANGSFAWRCSFERNKEGQDQVVFDLLKAELKAYSPIIKSLHKTSKEDDLLLEIALADVHLGRLCWAESDGDSYDLKIGRKILFDAVYDMVGKALKIGKYNRVCLWIGGDYLNCDNENGTTTAYTEQSMDSRFSKVFKEGKDILIEIINYLKQIAPIDVIITRGNHDFNSLFHMGEVMEAWFHNDENVKIDNSPAPRKYYTYGRNVIAFTHGDKVPLKKLPSIGAFEFVNWSSYKFKEWHTAHLHHEEMITENGAVKTRIISSIAGVDRYHSEHGYVGSLRCAQSFVWDKNNGLQNIIFSKPV